MSGLGGASTTTAPPSLREASSLKPSLESRRQTDRRRKRSLSAARSRSRIPPMTCRRKKPFSQELSRSRSACSSAAKPSSGIRRQRAGWRLSTNRRKDRKVSSRHSVRSRSKTEIAGIALSEGLLKAGIGGEQHVLVRILRVPAQDLCGAPDIQNDVLVGDQVLLRIERRDRQERQEAQHAFDRGRRRLDQPRARAGAPDQTRQQVVDDGRIRRAEIQFRIRAAELDRQQRRPRAGGRRYALK